MMTRAQVIRALNHASGDAARKVTVAAGDYWYTGWLIMSGPKRSNAFRVVVEDDRGRCFIHNLEQLHQGWFDKRPK